MFDINDEEGLILTPINNIFYPARYFPVGFNINQFNPSGGWLTGTYTANGSLDVSGDMENDDPALAGPFGVYVTADGTKLFSVELLDGTFFEYSLATPFDVTSTTLTASATVTTPSGSNIYGIDFSLDGTKLYTFATNTDSLVQYNLTTPFDITSINTTAAATLDCSSQNINYQALTIAKDGTHILAGGATNGDISSYTMSTPWDLSTATFKSRFEAPLYAENVFIRGLSIQDGGRRLAVLAAGTTAARLKIYNMTSPYDVSTLVLSSEIQTPLEALGLSAYRNYRGLHVTDDSSDFYIAINTSPYSIYRFTKD